LDLSNAVIEFSFSDFLANDFDNEQMKLLETYYLDNISINIGNRIFSSGNFCIIPGMFPQYYFKFPEDILKSQLNIDCK